LVVLSIRKLLYHPNYDGSSVNDNDDDDNDNDNNNNRLYSPGGPWLPLAPQL